MELGFLTALAATASGILGVYKGLNNFKEQKANLEAQIEDYENQITLADAQLEYTEQKNKSDNLTYNNAISETERSRDVSANLASLSNPVYNQSQYDELNTLRLQAAQEIGSVNYSQSISGFQQTGTQARIKSETENYVNKQIEQAENKANLSIMQSYMSAAENFYSANERISSYQEELKQINLSYELQMKEIEYNKTTLQNQKDYLQGQYDSMGSYDFDNIVVDFLSGLLGGF